MGGVLLTVILLGLLASFSPVIIAATATQLTRSSPIARALAVVTGVALATALIELVALGLLAGLQKLLSGGYQREIRIGFDLLTGSLLVLLAVRLWMNASQPAAANEGTQPEPVNESGPRRLKRLFVLGFTLMFLNPRVFLLVTAAVTQIRALDSWIEVVILLVVLYVVVNFFPSAPLIGYLISPAFAARIPAFTTWSVQQSKPAVSKARSARRWLLVDHRDWIEVLTLAAGLLLF